MYSTVKEHNKKFQSTAGSAVFLSEVIFYQNSVCLQSSSYICQRPLNLALGLANLNKKLPDNMEGKYTKIGSIAGVVSALVAIVTLYMSQHTSENDPPLPPIDNELVTTTVSDPIEQPVSIMIRDIVELRQGSSIKSSSLCVLMPSDYIVPLNKAYANNMKWCQVRVVDSQSCVKEYEGYVPCSIIK